MALSHVFGLFNIDACKISPLTSDPSGGTPVYGASVFVPGIRDLNITPDVLSKELYGDARVLSRKNKVRAINATVGNARLNTDAMAIMLGGTVTDTGTTPAQASTYDLLGTSQPSPFKLEAQILAIDGQPVGGDVHMVLWKAVVDTASLGGAQEDFAIPGFTITGTTLDSTLKMMSIITNETKVAIA